MSGLEWSGALLPRRYDLDDLKERIGRLFRRPRSALTDWAVLGRIDW